jgi:hypothetical protein
MGEHVHIAGHHSNGGQMAQSRLRREIASGREERPATPQ